MARYPKVFFDINDINRRNKIWKVRKFLSFLFFYRWGKNTEKSYGKMGFMVGRAPIRRTVKYLTAGRLAFKDNVKIFSVNYNAFGDHHAGARDFVFWKIPQVQHRNPTVQVVTMKNMTPSPFIRCYFGNLIKNLIGPWVITNRKTSLGCSEWRRNYHWHWQQNERGNRTAFDRSCGEIWVSLPVWISRYCCLYEMFHFTGKY